MLACGNARTPCHSAAGTPLPLLPLAHPESVWGPAEGSGKHRHGAVQTPGGHAALPLPCTGPGIPTSRCESCFQRRTAVAAQDAWARTTRTRSQPALGNMPWRSFPNVGTKGVGGGVVSVVPCHGGLGTSSCLSWGWTDRRGLTSHAPLQPCCLAFRPPPGINELLGMHIYHDCKTMTEARVGRLIVKKKVKFILIP